MKILFFCSGSYVFGKEYVSLDVIKGLKDKGHDIEVIFSGWHDGQFEKMLNEIGVPSHPLKLGWYYITKPKWSLDSLVHYPTAVSTFLKIKRRFRPDVIYFDSFRNIFLLKPFLKNKVLLHVHDPHSARSVKKMLKVADVAIDKYIAVSGFIKNDIAASDINPDKIAVVYNGVHSPADFDKKYMPEGVLRIGIVGQLIPRKGHADLLKACALIRNEVNFELHVYGSGDNEHIKFLKQEADRLKIYERITWHGFTTDKNSIYSNIDIIVVPTISEEPFALVPLEATMYMVPPVLYRSGGLPEGVIDSITGYVVEKNNYHQLAEKISYLFNNPSVLRDMGWAARDNSLKKFTKASMINGVEVVLTDLTT